MANVGFEFIGKMKMRGRFLLAGLALMVLAACDPQPAGPVSCVDAGVCEVVSLTAMGMRRSIGKDYGGGVVLRNARGLGSALLIDVSLPLSVEGFRTPVGQRIIHDFGKNVARGFCGSGASSDAFFQMGATLRARGFSKDNKLVADQIIRSCGRR